jgi:hypothetical protein
MNTHLIVAVLFISANVAASPRSECFSELHLNVIADQAKTKNSILRLLRSLNNDVKLKRLDAIAPYINYPITVSGLGKRYSLIKKEQITLNATEAFKNEMFANEDKCVAVNVSYKGIRFGKTGEIWINVSLNEKGEETIFIQTINFPYQRKK